MALSLYPRTIDLVYTIRRNGGIPKDVKYNKSASRYENILKYIESTYHCTHRMAMDATKYFMY